jgi:hypothetical protein
LPYYLRTISGARIRKSVLSSVTINLRKSKIRLVSFFARFSALSIMSIHGLSKIGPLILSLRITVAEAFWLGITPADSSLRVRQIFCLMT